MNFLDERGASGWEVGVTTIKSGDKVVSESVGTGDERRRGRRAATPLLKERLQQGYS